jgi:hypothetical protein
MFTEYDVAGVINKTGLRPNGTGWRDLMAKNQFTAANQGPAFAKILMGLFAQIETSARQSKQTPSDSEKHHPLSITPKGRYFGHCVANEREQCPRYLKLNEHCGNYETYQYFIDTGDSLICSNCRNNGLPSEATYLGIASEIARKKLRDGATIEAQASNASARA